MWLGARLFFFLHRAYVSAFSVVLLHLPLLFTNCEAAFRLKEGSTWVVLAGVPPTSLDPQCLDLQPGTWL